MKISGSTRLTGLIGWPVSHSLSPAMHNAAAAALGLDLVYLPLPVRPEDVETAVRGLPALGFLGINVTIPHKEAVMPFLDEIDAAARAIGAVNTIVVGGQGVGERGSRGDLTTDYRLLTTLSSLFSQLPLLGYNTDWSGFLEDLEALGVGVRGRDCLILGAGGSARAVAYALATAGGRIHIFARRVEQAAELAQDLQPHLKGAHLDYRPLHDLEHLPGDVYVAPLIVNTTPLGMTPSVEASPWPDDQAFPPGAFVYDLIYNPAETKLMQQAQTTGCPTANGLGMLIRQGAQAFRLWTGQEPDVAVMTAAIMSSQVK